MYKEADYAGSRINHTIVRLGDEPVYVHEVYGDMTCAVSNADGDDKRVSLDDLNVLAPPLGFFNHNGTANYLSRRPLRNDYRQGIRTSQLVILKGHMGEVRRTHVMRCIKGEYPTLSSALDKISEGAESVAISRDLCLEGGNGSINLCYKWYGEVGTIVKGEVVLSEGNEHLQYCLKGLV